MRKYITVLLSFLALTLLSGCGQSADTPSLSEEGGVTAQWRTEGFAAPGKLEDEQIFWTDQYLPWEHKSQTSATGTDRIGCLDSGVCGELFWYFGAEPESDGTFSWPPSGEYVLEIYDTVSGECTVKRFSPAELGLQNELGGLSGMDILDGEHYVLQWVEYEQNEEGMYLKTGEKMVYTDLLGDTRTTDLWDIFLEKGIEQQVYSERPWVPVRFRCDGNGNIYVTMTEENGNSRFYLFGKDGEILLEQEAPGLSLLEPLRTPDGELIFPVYNSTDKCYEFLWADKSEGELRSLARMETSIYSIVQMYGMLGDDIYYRSRENAENGSGEGIVRWNIRSGMRTFMFGFQTAGIDTGFQTMLALREGQTPFLRLTNNKDGEYKEWLTPLSQQKTDSADIRVANLTMSEMTKEWIAKSTTLASMEDPNFRYVYEDASAQEDRDRLLIELSQGKGPDLMFVSIEDMYMLEEKGLLMDIGELIPQEIREQLLPGALEIGTVNGRLLGVPVGVHAETLVISSDIWQENTWSLEDVITLMEEGKLSGAIRSNYLMGDYLSPELTVVELIVNSLNDSFLIDWENRKCHFDDERFIRLLELTSADLSNVPAGTQNWLDEGENIVWGYFLAVTSFLNFFDHIEKENGLIVGYPTGGACGSYLVAEGGVLVANANIAKREEAACFLKTLLGDEIQSQTNILCLGVRRIDPEYYIAMDESGRLSFFGGDFAPEVHIFEDGSTSLHRAETFLEDCVALPPRYPQIIRIVTEELSAFYAGDKSAEATAETIDRRVQLYLDEGN